MQKLSIVIMAAGKGSRMKSSTPKVLHKLCGKEQLYYIIKEAQKISDDISVIVAHQKERVIEAMKSYFHDINFIAQDLQNFPGTGGAIRNISPKYEKVLVLNGDMPLIQAEVLEEFGKIDADIVMSIFNLQDPSGYGRVKIEDNEVSYIVEEKDATNEQKAITTVNAGVYAFKRAFLEEFVPKLSNQNAQKEYYITDLITLAKENNKKVAALLVNEKHFMGVNSKTDLAKAEEVMCTRIKQKWMQAGVIMHLPHTIYIEEDVVFEGECIVEQGVMITGKSYLKDAHIKAHSVIEESEVINSDVGPLAHIRPASKLTDTHIGNFVEVKKSTLNGVKAGHLSYLGDSEIDEGTNIGAGVITCNYDGKAKYQTKIGKNVFVGSDSQIVAPVVIEDDVMIAAGTTLTKDTPKGSLAISRAPLKFVANFFYKFFK